MKTSLNISNLDLFQFHKNWPLFLTWGIALMVLGGFAISATTFTTLMSVIILGVIVLASGVVLLVDAFTFWRQKGKGFFLHLAMSILYLAAGFMLIQNPVSGSISLTLILGILYLLLGATRLIYSLSIRSPKWGWGFFNGLISLLLGILILVSWPESSLYIIGLFVGIDLLFSGWAYVMAALAARQTAAIQ